MSYFVGKRLHGVNMVSVVCICQVSVVFSTKSRRMAVEIYPWFEPVRSCWRERRAETYPREPNISFDILQRAERRCWRSRNWSFICCFSMQECRSVILPTKRKNIKNGDGTIIWQKTQVMDETGNLDMALDAQGNQLVTSCSWPQLLSLFEEPNTGCEYTYL